MNRGIVAIIVFIVLMTASVLEMFYVEDRIKDLDSQIKVLYEYMEQDKEHIDTSLNKKTISKIENQWNKDKIIFHFLFSHMQINELSYKITALNRHIHQNDYNMANTAASAIIKNCEMILSYFYPTLQNVL
ncbi:MAG TPA: DUF4363 family protein [Clostridiales bacterium]|nr:DUF4363 family protein [Clostridiales bacterium]